MVAPCSQVSEIVSILIALLRYRSISKVSEYPDWTLFMRQARDAQGELTTLDIAPHSKLLLSSEFDVSITHHTLDMII